MQAESLKDPAAANKKGTSQTKDITASFTANVWEIQCKAGAQIKKGDTLLVLEAMKMEYPVIADTSGEILEIHADSNSLVQQGDVLITLALASASTPEE